jgi:sugar phosphate isomerase/epimerase
LPIGEIARAWIVEMGFKGWVSMEVFDRRLRDGSVSVETAARRGIESWRKVQAEMEEKSRL